MDRWTGWRGWITWTVGAVAYHVYMMLPWPIAKQSNWLLPYAGDYAYWDDAMRARESNHQRSLRR